jgi:Zn ribbon nucleic-acid-binding protein
VWLANPCPKCNVDADLAVYRYDSGWHHVECMRCNYLGPGAGSERAAIKLHNAAHPIRKGED